MLAVYRVVQEALTNALKYAAARRSTLELTHDDEAVELRIVNAGHVAGSDGEGGRGLVGMRERVAVYGGTLETGPLSTARLPSPRAAAHQAGDL